MSIVLLLICLALIFINVLISKGLKSTRKALITTFVIYGLITTLSTEILSLFTQLNKTSLAITWGIILFINIALIIKTKRTSFKNIINIYFNKFQDLHILNKCILIFICLILCINFAISLYVPPNTWDSMTYHMSRIEHWVQNNTVKHYPTNILRQLYQNPWAEYSIMQSRILSGTDTYANLTQFFSLIGCIIAISLIAKTLGCSKTGQLSSGLTVLSIPMAILQSTSTQNDLTVSFWIVTSIYLFLEFNKSRSFIDLILLTTSISIATLTKPTSYVFLFPFLCIGAIYLFTKNKTIFLKFTFCLIITFTVINSGHMYRNYKTFKTPIASGEEGYINNNFSFPSILSNLTKSLLLHCGSQSNPIYKAIESKVIQLHKLIRIDINDTKISWIDFDFPRPTFDEDSAGNTIHLMLILISASWLLITNKENKLLRFYIICSLSGFILFCILLKWQPWNSRLQLPFFIITSAFIGFFIENKLKNKYLESIIILILITNTFLFITLNTQKPIVGKYTIFNKSRNDLSFIKKPFLINSYANIKQFLNNSSCKNIGLLIGKDDWEYPLFKLTNNNSYKFMHLTKKQNKLNINSEQIKPCLVINTYPTQFIHYLFEETIFIKTRAFDTVSIFEPDFDGKLNYSNSIYHFNKILGLINLLRSSMTNNPSTNQILLISKTILQESSLIDVNILQNINPELPQAFNDIILKANKALLFGIMNNNSDLIKFGFNLINTWDIWIKSNIQNSAIK